jgi:hypothetical protein
MVRLGGLKITAILSGAWLLAGCGTYSSFGFPIEQGNIEAGRKAFVDHQCHACHSVAGVRLPPLAGAPDPIFELGGEISQIKAYSELVTSIINPDHRISEQYLEQLRGRGIAPLESPMPMRHIDTMTVRQLIDLVAFLDTRYILIDDYETMPRPQFPASGSIR